MTVTTSLHNESNPENVKAYRVNRSHSRGPQKEVLGGGNHMAIIFFTLEALASSLAKYQLSPTTMILLCWLSTLETNTLAFEVTVKAGWLSFLSHHPITFASNIFYGLIDK